jgi:hypothetical protein
MRNLVYDLIFDGMHFRENFTAIGPELHDLLAKLSVNLVSNQVVPLVRSHKLLACLLFVCLLMFENLF